MGEILKSSLSKKNISKVREIPRLLYFFIGVFLLAACGSGKSDEFLCQGLGANTVSGTVRYEKRLYDQNGFTGQRVFIPVRFAPVEVRSGQILLATVTTDDQGRYCAIYLNPIRTLNTVIVFASNLTTSKVQVGSFFRTSIDEPFQFLPWWVQEDFDERQGGTSFSVNFDLRNDLNNPNINSGGVFNILDTLVKGREVLKSMTGQDAPLVTTIWDRTLGGTFFVPQEECPQAVEGGAQGIVSDCLFIRGDGELFIDQVLGGDRDEYDDDIILHEYGHFIAHNFSKDDSPGGVHTLGDHSQDIRLSWSEGWATFFSSAVRRNPMNVDVGVDGAADLAFSIESNGNIQTTNEIAVASALWDIFDNLDRINEPHDSLFLDFRPIWDVLTFWRETATPPRITMDAFWDSFGTTQPAFLNIANDRKMRFFSDSFEGDNTRNPNRLATPGLREQHTIFPDGDIDYIAFNTVIDQSYTVETLALENGADTFLEILDIAGQTIARNDDFNRDVNSKNFQGECNAWSCYEVDQETGKCTGFGPRTLPACPNGRSRLPLASTLSPDLDNPFPSRVTFVAPTSGIFYAKVYRSPNALLSTSRYGSYDFKVTQVPSP